MERRTEHESSDMVAKMIYIGEQLPNKEPATLVLSSKILMAKLQTTMKLGNPKLLNETTVENN